MQAFSRSVGSNNVLFLEHAGRREAHEMLTPPRYKPGVLSVHVLSEDMAVMYSAPKNLSKESPSGITCRHLVESLKRRFFPDSDWNSLNASSVPLVPNLA